MDIYNILLIVVGGSGLLMIGYLIYKAKKEGQSIPWIEIQPILFDTFFKIQNLSHLRNADYITLENYTVKLIQEAIDKTDLIKPSQKILITDDLVRRIVRVRLEKIYKDNQEQ